MEYDRGYLLRDTIVNLYHDHAQVYSYHVPTVKELIQVILFVHLLSQPLSHRVNLRRINGYI